jgi:hypothetical protein
MTIHDLAADYFAKSDAYKALAMKPTPTDFVERMNHTFAVDKALDAAVEASVRLKRAREAEELRAAE